jgi:endonuclease III
MLSLTERAARVRRIDRLLERMHGRQVREHTGTGLDMLVEAMLAQNTNLSNALAGYKQLKRAFPTWNKVLAASVADVQRHIAICGLARMRARRLQALLRRLKDEHGKLSIDFLANMDVRSAEEHLLSFHGIGPKTAGYTLLFAFGMPIFPVDNGILRVARRLRLVRLIARDAEAGKVLAQLTPPKRIYSLHVLMFTHSKKLCRPKNPKCDECLLLDLCPHGQRRMKHRPPDPIVRVNGRPVIRSHYASAGIRKRGMRDIDDFALITSAAARR